MRGVLATYSREQRDTGFAGPPLCIAYGLRYLGNTYALLTTVDIDSGRGEVA